MEYEFTSESVSIGHPDKVADLISDSVATFLLSKNISHRAAIETLVTTNMAVSYTHLTLPTKVYV